jgi:hypothetical protein
MLRSFFQVACCVWAVGCSGQGEKTRVPKKINEQERGQNLPAQDRSAEGRSPSSEESSPIEELIQPTLSIPAVISPQEPRFGFYGFDGTGEVKANNHIIAQLMDDGAGDVREYFEGPDLIGSNTRSIIEAGKARICSDWLSGRIDRVALTGYSRGAMIAVAIAGELTRSNISKDPERVFCGNSAVDKSLLANVPNEKRKPNFVWIGLLDAVDTANYDLLDSVEGTGAKCFHLAKKNEWEAVLTTKNINGCEKARVSGSKRIAFISMPLQHVDLATDRDSLMTLVREAKASGLGFKSM